MFTKTITHILSRSKGYLLGILFVAAATWAKYVALPDIIPADVPILYFLAIVPTAIYFGLGPSVLVCVLSLWAFDFYFVPPLYQINPDGFWNTPILLIFLLIGLIFSYTASNLRKKNEKASKEIIARKKSEAELAKLGDNLEAMVQNRTSDLEKTNYILEQEIAVRIRAETALKQRTTDLEVANKKLEISNKELEAFSYSVSHDLRTPLRSIEGFSQALLEDYGGKLTEEGNDFLGRIQSSTRLMSQLIDDLLNLSRVTRREMRFENVDLCKLAETVFSDLKKEEPERMVDFNCGTNLIVHGDSRLLLLVINNLLANAWKFTSRTLNAKVEFGLVEQNGKNIYFVRDNGAGFDMTYANKLFTPFQRLHKTSDFPGTGVGLASAQRIIRRHGGEIWAESIEGNGATFYFTLNE